MRVKTHRTTRPSEPVASTARRAQATQAERAARGRRGEAIAATHLVRRGFELVARNHRTRAGEIDIVAFDGRTLAFVEVKARHALRARPGRESASEPGYAAGGFGWPSRGQRMRLRRLARAWLAACPPATRPRARELRFDAIRVLLDDAGELLALEHIEGAW